MKNPSNGVFSSLRFQAKQVKGKSRWYLVKSYRNAAGQPRTKWLVYLGDAPTDKLKKSLEMLRKHPEPAQILTVKEFVLGRRGRRKVITREHDAKLQRRRELYAAHKSGLPVLRKGDMLSRLRFHFWDIRQKLADGKTISELISRLTADEKKEAAEQLRPYFQLIDEIWSAMKSDESFKTPLHGAGQSLQPHVKNLLKLLPDREAEIMRLRFGFDDGTAKTLAKIGEQFGVTRERIRQIEKRALQKMRR